MALRELFFAEISGLRHFVTLICGQIKFFLQIFQNACVKGPKPEETLLRVPFIAEILGLRHFVALIRTLIKFSFTLK